MASSGIPNASAAPEEAPTTPIALHPLVIVNITDHFTRARMVAGAHNGRAVGVLLGQQSGRKVEVFTSFELIVEARGDAASVDAAFFRQRRESFQTVFPDYDVVGWYTTGKGISAADVEGIHKNVFVDANEAAIALVLDPEPPKDSRELPVYIFETRAAGAQLARVPFTVESEESERIGVETAMRVEFDDSGDAGLEPAAIRLRSAVEMLREQIAVVVRYVEAVEAGTVAPDWELLRRIGDVVAQLPRGDAPQLLEAMAADTRDALLVAFLGVVSKGVAQLQHLQADSAVMRDGAVSRKGARQMMQGM